jgi:hypothetical protein
LVSMFYLYLTRKDPMGRREHNFQSKGLNTWE